jgi:hypothetical protein
MILGSSGTPRVKVGLWIGSHWNRVLWVSSVSDDFFPEGFVQRIEVKVFHRAYAIDVDF